MPSEPRKRGFFGRLPDPILGVAALVAVVLLGIYFFQTMSGTFTVVKDPGVAVGASREEVQGVLGPENRELSSVEELQEGLLRRRTRRTVEVVAGDCLLHAREPKGLTLEGVPEGSAGIAHHFVGGINEFLFVLDSAKKVHCIVWVNQN